MADTAFIDGHYLARSWRMLTQDDGWVKPILVLALVSWIPFIGPIGVTGYVMGWTRLTAWGIDSAPKQRKVDVGRCISSGWTAFVVALGWGLVGALIVSLIVAVIPILAVICWIALLFYNVVVMVAITRATIYQRIGPGYGLSQVFDMAGRDYGGLIGIIGIQLLEALICLGIALVVVIILALALAGPITRIATLYYYYGSQANLALTPGVIDLIAGSVSWLGPIIVVVGYIFSIVQTTFTLITYNAVGLWMRQFDVPRWGGPAEPVPQTIPPAPYNAGEPEQGAPNMPPLNPMENPYDGGPAPVSPEPERTPGAPEDVGEPVVPPTAEDLYDTATLETTEWTDVVSPTPDATFHMEWDEKATEKPAKADQHGVRPPTPGELYTEASEAVSHTWPDVDLASSDAVPAMDDAQMAEAVNEAMAVEAAAKGERPPAPEKPVVPAAPDEPKPEVPQSEVTPPTEKDLYETATAATTRWTEVVTPPEPGTGVMGEPADAPTQVPPAVKDDGGVEPPTAPELYTQVAGEVSHDWPDVDLQSKDAVASIDDAEVKEAVDEAIDELHGGDDDGEVTHLI